MLPVRHTRELGGDAAAEGSLVRSAGAGLVALVLLGAASVAAAAPADDARPSEPEPAGMNEPLTTPRAVPDYDGRPPPRPGAGELLLWIPRTLLFPAYLVSEYGLRWPLGKAASFIERHHVVERIADVTTWDEGRAGILPVAHFDSGLASMVGLTLYWDDLVARGSHLRAGAETDFGRNFVGRLQGRRELQGAPVRLELELANERRDDFVFFGVGPDTTNAGESRFYRNKTLAAFQAELVADGAGAGGWLTLEVSDNRFDCGERGEHDICGRDRVAGSGDDRYDLGEGGEAAYFERGYQLARVKARAYWDSREPRPASGTGARLELQARYGRGLGADSSDVHFVRYGGEASLFWDLRHGGQRTLGLRLLTELADPVAGGALPFAELITLGGLDTMRGFVHARFHGRSAVVATLEYRYPVWSFVDGTLFVEAGNTFGPALEDFSLEALRGVAGVGIRTIESRHVSLDVTLAVGTTPLGDPLEIDYVRVNAGTNWGF